MLFLFLSFLELKAQVRFQKVYLDTLGGPGIVEPTSDGYILAGQYQNVGGLSSINIYLVKTDLLGDTLWTRTFSCLDSGYIQFLNLESTSDGGYAIFCRTHQNQIFSFFLVKTDMNGDTLWTRKYEGSPYDQALGGNTTMDGGFIMTGLSYDGASKGYVVRIDPAGNIIWAKRFDNASHTMYGYWVTEMTDSNILVMLHKGGVIKLNSSGDTIWAKFFKSSQSQIVFEEAIECSDGNYLLVGDKHDSIPEQTDILVAKIDVNGNIIWSKTYGGANYEVGISVEETQSGNFMMVGNSCEFDSWPDTCLPLLLKIDSTGNPIWARIYGEPANSNCAFRSRHTQDGGIIVSGNWHSPINFISGAYLIKTDSLGFSACTEQTISIPDGSPAIQSYQNPITISTAGQQSNFATVIGRRIIPQTLCSSVGVNRNSLSNKSKLVYPNPANSSFIFEGSDYIKGQLQIYNAVGLKIFDSEINNSSMTIESSDFADGIYFVKVSNHSGYSEVIKVIVDH